MHDAVERPVDVPSRRAFVLRRLHSLTGAVPVGVFLVEHIWTNAAALAGPEAFDRSVGAIQRMTLLPVIELVFIFLPLGFHAGYGIWLTRQGRPNAGAYPYARNILYVLQRASGVVVLAFVLLHLWELRVQKWLFGLGADAFYTKLAEHLSWTAAGVPWIAVGYVVGLAASAFHLSNGLATMAISWGVTTTRTAQRRAAAAAAALGVFVFLAGTTTVVGLATGSRLLPDAEGGKNAACPGALSPEERRP